MELPKTIQCPWCGEAFTTFVDLSVADQDYIEDCQVCCRPIKIDAHSNLEEGDAEVRVERS